MIVCEDEPLFVDDHTCTKALLLEILWNLVLEEAFEEVLERSFGPKGMGIWPLPLTTFTVLMFTTEFFAFLASSAKDTGTPEASRALCCGIRVRPARSIFQRP